jgi:membrane associated rhomboid family serine protease
MISITLSIVILTVLISFSAFNNEKIKEDLLFWPAQIDSQKQYYRFFTNGFVHGDLIHLAFNMLALYSFGQALELSEFPKTTLFGSKAKLFFIGLYVLGLFFSVLPDYFKYRNNYAYRALGASGAVSAMIFSFIMLNPTRELSIFFIRGVPGYIFGIIFIALSAFLAKRGGGNIGHRAHISGAIFGILYTVILAKIIGNQDILVNFWELIKSRY